MPKVLQDISIGKNIQILRKARGMTQVELCSQLGALGRPMLQSTYAQIETGTRNIFVSDLIAIKRILNVSYDEIFKDLEPIIKGQTPPADESKLPYRLYEGN